MSERESEEAEGLSRRFAEAILTALGERDMAIHEHKPIRRAVLRKGKRWLPAVLRWNQVPTRVLFEVVNLNHVDDNRLLESPEFREATAGVYVDALRSFFGSSAKPQTAKR